MISTFHKEATSVDIGVLPNKQRFIVKTLTNLN